MSGDDARKLALGVGARDANGVEGGLVLVGVAHELVGELGLAQGCVRGGRRTESLESLLFRRRVGDLSVPAGAAWVLLHEPAELAEGEGLALARETQGAIEATTRRVRDDGLGVVGLGRSPVERELG